MTPQQFIAKWREAQLSERSAYQQHFCDLCDLLGQPKPAEADPAGSHYTFERGVTKTGGGNGWADVWKRGRFGWEYKGKHKDLAAAYQQLLRYREDLENPPLLVVCDLDRFEIHTNFPNTVKRVYAFSLADFDQADNLDTLRKLFTDPEALKPGLTAEAITAQAAERFGLLADGLRQRQIDPQRAAHFLMKLMFSMFAEDVGLLPEKLFQRVLLRHKHEPAKLNDLFGKLFTAMSSGGDFGVEAILHFNGGLFNDADTIELKPAEIQVLVEVNAYDWGSVEPSIFGTLFERTLDPAKRSQIGAHYTSKADILTLLEPVVMQPLRREWDAVREQCDALWLKIQQTARAKSRMQKAAITKKEKSYRPKLEALLRQFSERLAHVTILDPACGSGNFLYVAINLLLDLNKEVIRYAANHGLGLYPIVEPTQLHGIEINPYARELAQVAIWIGYLQWLYDNGFGKPEQPILKPIETIRHTDAILDLSDPAHPKEPEWPAADFIVGNPPFLGGKLLRTHLGDEYVNSMFKVWDERVPREADVCCYWFEKGRQQIERKRAQRVGLLATQGIRGGKNRDVLKRILETGNIFFGVSDRDWILDGAHVHVSLIGFDAGDETCVQLDGKPSSTIYANLTSAVDTTRAVRLSRNVSLAFMGDTKVGPFEISESQALTWCTEPNASGLPNSTVLRPWANSLDLTRRDRRVWIIDFPPGSEEVWCALFEKPFEYILKHVKPFRARARSGDRTGVKWFVHQRPRPEMRNLIEGLPRFICTPTVSKHRLFAWMPTPLLPDHQLIAFGMEVDWEFGLLTSRHHEIWARAQGTQLRERESGFRYTPTTCFETFPFPESTDEQREAIAAAARELDQLRNNWLNPPEWTRQEILEFPGSASGPWSRYIVDISLREMKPHAEREDYTIGTVRYPRLIPKDEECAKQLAKRTLTNLYNARPTWLDLAHRKLDAAVSAAYGWPAELSDDEILSRLLALNLTRASVTS